MTREPQPTTQTRQVRASCDRLFFLLFWKTDGKKPNLTTVGKSARIPQGALIGAGVVVASEVDEDQFMAMYPSGEVPDNARLAYTGP